MACVGQRGAFRPFDFKWGSLTFVLHYEIDFRPIACAQIGQFAVTEVLQPPPKLQPHPLLE